jgi:predicted DNA-binding transcriptional regulator YafY
MNRFERLLAMVPWLVKHQGISHQEVADHFQITKAQMLQDVMLLTVTGIGQFANEQFDVDYSNEKIFVRDELGLDRPFSFDSTEAACLLLGLDALANLPAQASGFNISEIQSVRERISNAIPVPSGISVLQGNVEATQLMSDIAQALQDNLRISFDYWNDARDDVVRRTVSPYQIYSVNQVSKLDALEHGKGWRTFKLANIDSLVIEKELADFENSSFTPMETIDVDISVPLRMHYLLEGFSVVKRRNIDKQTLKATILISQPIWLARQILASGCAIEVLGPDAVQEQVKSFIDTARAAYPRNSKPK